MSKLYILIVNSVLVLSTSCTKETVSPDDNTLIETTVSVDTVTTSPLTGTPRLVTYELSGDFSGKTDITFLSSEGFTAPNQVIGVNVPWQTSYNIPSDAQAIGGFANGLNGDAIAGETAQLKMFLDDYLIETVIRTANKDGLLTAPIESYLLEFDDSQAISAPEYYGTEVRYLVEGNFEGSVNLIYRTIDGSKENILINNENLPWTYNYITSENSNKASIYGSGINGTLGQSLTLSIFLNDKITETITYASNKEGSISNGEIIVNFK